MRLLLALLLVLGAFAVASPGTALACTADGVVIDGDKVMILGEVVADKALLDAACAEGQLNLYGSGGTVREQNLIDAFRERFPGIQVELTRLVGARLYERVLTEASAGIHRVDVIHMSDLALTADLIDQGLIGYHVPPADPMWPEGFKQTGLWYGAYIVEMSIGYNSALVRPEDAPKTWADLLDPKWKGRNGRTFAGIGGTGWTLAWFERAVISGGTTEYWEKVAAQNPIIYSSAAALTDALARGEILVGVNAGTSDYTAMVAGAPLAAVYPPEGVGANVYGLSMAANAPHSAAAKLYINWLVSRDGQLAQAMRNGVFSARDDIPSPDLRPDRSEITLIAPPLDEYLSLRDEWIEDWNEIFEWSN